MVKRSFEGLVFYYKNIYYWFSKNERLRHIGNYVHATEREIIF